MRQQLLLITALVVLTITAQASVPVWSTDVAPILYNHCTSCHHSGGIAPFALMTYGDAVANASSMQADVTAGKMPPWPPDHNYSHFAHERILTPTEITTIADWVGGGTLPGTLSAAPPMPVYSAVGELPGIPDLIVKIPTYTSTAASGDLYQCFSIPSGLLTDKYVTAFEAIPGNPAIVHHVLVFSDTTGACAALDAATPGPGYTNFGGVGSSNAVMVGAWVPGSAAMVYPNGFGLRIPHHADIALQIHYPAGTVGLIDSTEVHFFFSSAATVRDVYIAPVLNHETNIDSPINIPANTFKTYHEHQISPFNVSLLGLAPHMHLIGTSIESYAVLPAGDTDRYINIPEWDFHWQGFYSFPRLKHLPALSTLYADAVYNNTTSNPENPSSPPQTVTAGESTTDEMMIVYFVYTAYQAGDEDIIVDSAVALNTPNQFSNYYHGQQLLGISPNPAATDITIKCFLENANMCSIELVDMQGRVIKQLAEHQNVAKGYSVLTYPIAGIAPGTYSLRMRTQERILTQKLVILQ